MVKVNARDLSQVGVSARSRPTARQPVMAGLLCLALLVVGIDGTIVDVTFPTLVRELHATSSHCSESSTRTRSSSPASLADRRRQRPVPPRPSSWSASLIFRYGSFGSTLVGTTALIISRVQGLRTAFIMPPRSILTNIFTDAQSRGRRSGSGASGSASRSAARRRPCSQALLVGFSAW